MGDTTLPGVKATFVIAILLKMSGPYACLFQAAVEKQQNASSSKSMGWPLISSKYYFITDSVDGKVLGPIVKSIVNEREKVGLHCINVTWKDFEPQFIVWMVIMSAQKNVFSVTWEALIKHVGTGRASILGRILPGIPACNIQLMHRENCSSCQMYHIFWRT